MKVAIVHEMIENDEELSLDQRETLKKDLLQVDVEIERITKQKSRASVSPRKSRSVTKSKIELPSIYTK